MIIRLCNNKVAVIYGVIIEAGSIVISSRQDLRRYRDEKSANFHDLHFKQRAKLFNFG